VDLLLELFVELLGEFLLQLFAEVVVAVAWGILGAVVETEQVRNTVVSAIMYVFLGTLMGFISLAAFPHPLVRPSRVHGISLLISPVVTGSVMALIGSILRRNNKKVVPIESFGYGFVFAFGMALIRLIFVKV